MTDENPTTESTPEQPAVPVDDQVVVEAPDEVSAPADVEPGDEPPADGDDVAGADVVTQLGESIPPAEYFPPAGEVTRVQQLVVIEHPDGSGRTLTFDKVTTSKSEQLRLTAEFLAS